MSSVIPFGVAATFAHRTLGEAWLAVAARILENGRASEYDEKAIRERAVALGVPVITTVAGALAAVSGIEALRRGPLDVTALQEAL